MTALKGGVQENEMSRLSQLNSERAITADPNNLQSIKEGGAPLNPPLNGGETPGLDGAAAFQEQQNRQRIQASKQPINPHIQSGIDRGAVSAEQAQAFSQKINQLKKQVEGVENIAHLPAFKQKMIQEENSISDLIINNDTRKEIDKARLEFWSELQTTLTAAEPESFGMAISAAAAIDLIRINKTMKLKGKKEHLGISYLLTPPVFGWYAKDMWERLRSFAEVELVIVRLFWMAFVFSIIGLLVYFSYMIFSLYNNPEQAATDGQMRNFADNFIEGGSAGLIKSVIAD